MIASATVAERHGPWPIAAGIAVLALVEAVIGLQAVAFHSLPDAERIVRAWEPGGTFEYPPALAILQVGALPILAVIVDRARPTLAGIAAAALVLAGAVLRLADSRLALALAAIALLSLLICPPAGRRPRQPPPRQFLSSPAGPWRRRSSAVTCRAGTRRGATGLAEIMGLAVVAAFCGRSAAVEASDHRRFRHAAGTGGRRSRRRDRRVRRRDHERAGATTAPSAERFGTSRRPAPDDVFHGRPAEWLAAIETWLDRPFLGAGTGSYYIASLSHQTVARSVYAHNLPLELAAELGILGLVLGVVLYVSAGWTITRALDSPAVWLVGPLVLAFLVSNLFDWTWHLAGLAAAWAAACGALTAAAQRSRAVSR